MFMPLLNDKLAVLDCKRFGLGQFVYLHPLRLAQLDARLDVENRFAAAMPDVDMCIARAANLNLYCISGLDFGEPPCGSPVLQPR